MINTPQQSILELFSFLPRSNDEFFYHLWHQKKLRYDDSGGKIDDIDVYNAKLTCAALAQHQSLLIVLPDHASRRMPLMFVTGLVMHTLDFMTQAHNHNVLYFGTSASIKHYLSQTYIRKQRMSDIFNQTYIHHSAMPLSDLSGRMPNVIFSYTPTNVEQIIKSYNPKWVFIDCGEGEQTDWVSPLLEKLKERKIVGIACVHNPLSNISEIFEKSSWDVFSWAATTGQPSTITEIIPLSIQSKNALDQAERLQKANQALSGCIRETNGRLQRDAWRSVGRLVRCLENLSVPLKFFEAESRNFWGIHSVQELRQTAARFIESLERDPLGRKLEGILTEVEPLIEQFINNKPPLWLALEQLCIDPPDAPTPAILIFQNRAYKQLFSLAMLAENNIAEHELQKINVWLLSLKQFAQWQFQMERLALEGIDPPDIPSSLKEKYPNWQPILVGVPNKYNYAKYVYLLRHSKIQNLLLPHQLHLAAWHFMQWITRLDKAPLNNLGTLQHLIPNEVKDLSLFQIEEKSIHIHVELERKIIIDDESESVRTRLSKLLEIAPRAEELAQLMDEFSPESEDVSVSDTSENSFSDTQNTDDRASVDRVLVVRFEEKFEAMFDLDSKIQTVIETSNGRDLQERSVRSLRLGNVVIFINGQQRQSLYDLIVSRVHDHPTFSLHISLILRWQDELLTCFKAAKIPLSTVLKELQAKGSRIKTETAIRFWLLGYVMCPEDSKDLQRIAEILDMPFVKQYYSHIDKAARRLRGIHISLARKLNTWLEQEFFSENHHSFNDVIDAELGLEFRDFRDALRILTVESISEQTGIFLKTDLGRLTSWVHNK